MKWFLAGLFSVSVLAGCGASPAIQIADRPHDGTVVAYDSRNFQLLANDAANRMKSYAHRYAAVDEGFKALKSLRELLGKENLVILGGYKAAYAVIEDEESTYQVLLRTLDCLSSGGPDVDDRMLFSWALRMMEGTIDDRAVGTELMKQVVALHGKPEVVAAARQALAGAASAPTAREAAEILRSAFRKLRAQSGDLPRA